ncbi:MAG TPA: methyltransferase domain-containing protein [Anaerolineales bacterium]|nr:methyltransferase domain-containing protein [Anaerolineales bacterium]
MIDSRPVCDYEGSNYQSEFWDRGEREYEDRAERIALNAFLPKAGKLALELGAGAGRLTPLLAMFERVVLLDYSRTQLQQARARLGDSNRYTFVAANVYQLPFGPGIFDGATMIRVIHHLADAPAALKEIRSVLAPGATFILEFANKQNWKAIFRYLLRQQAWSPFALEPVEFVKLNFDFHPRAIRGWLNEIGFNVEHQRTVSHYRLGLLKRTIPANVLAAVDGLIQPTGDLLQFSPSVFAKCVVRGERGAREIRDIREILRCPLCKGNLNGDDTLSCESGHRWGYRDGVYDFKEQIEG